MLLQHHCLFIQILILFVDLPQHQQGRPPEGLRSGQGKQPGKVSLTNYIGTYNFSCIISKFRSTGKSNQFFDFYRVTTIYLKQFQEFQNHLTAPDVVLI